MIHLYVDKGLGKIVLETDDPSVRFLLEAVTKNSEYIPWQRKWGVITKTYRIYEEKRQPKLKNGRYTYTFGLGWAAYLVNTFRPYISIDDYNAVLTDAIYSDSFRTFPFPELRDDQNEDVLHILKFRIGLFSCYTGYGKTQVIAAIANYAYGLGKSVLLVTPGKKAQDELIKRCKTVFGLDIPSKDGKLDCIITSGLLNRKDYKDPVKRAVFENKLSGFEWVLADEVEYTINDSGRYLYSKLTRATNLYGFSGTSDKQGAESITFISGLSEVVLRNMDLIKFFGPNLVYRMPLNKEIDDIQVKTAAFDLMTFDRSDFDKNTNVYMRVMTKIWTDSRICEVIKKIIHKFPLTFIPINNLASILTEWIDNWFLGEFRILLVCGEGYIYYDLHGNRTKIDLSTACDYISKGMVDVIPSTAAGYRALDFPGLENILLIEGLKAGVVLQSIGRVARSPHMNIITLSGISDKKIPVYTKSDESRKDLYQTYYKYCNITESIIYENNL